MLRSITIPPPIQFDDAKVPARVYYSHVLGTDMRFNRDRAGARIAKRIDDAFEAASEGVPALLAEADWEKFKEAIEKPQPMDGAHPFPTRHAYKYVPCMDAVVDAAEVKNAALAPAKAEESNGSPKKSKPAAEAAH